MEITWPVDRPKNLDSIVALAESDAAASVEVPTSAGKLSAPLLGPFASSLPKSLVAREQGACLSRTAGAPEPTAKLNNEHDAERNGTFEMIIRPAARLCETLQERSRAKTDRRRRELKRTIRLVREPSA